ncbi:hypothetical protein SAMN05421734_102261 [Pelagirhabdus alkalitolerans]|uniref:Polymer-forming protein n=1 Tax=Pelagirhabdus alkalitolerans TaxID=1612202 RepID=A0A1G6H5G7_9BACI|nr:hypothetical protein [Pelagirhabdus alkalitolerans]SDB89509.1 hypothetical protein SAMN05421734_102261 [Pelagirhabdus alkalitolerans]
MKKWMTLLMTVLVIGLLAACGADGVEEDTADDNGDDADATTAATQVNVESEDELLEGISDDGAWIVIFHEDIETDEELVLTGGFTNNNDEPDRKLALYAQDEDRNITDQFTLTAPSITIENEATRIQGGTFAGDVYVEAEGFRLPADSTIDGDLIFASEEYQDSADIEEGTVTGSVEVQ